MFKLNKLADYATVLMAFMAAHASQAYNARDLAVMTHIALPTVSKILKLMAKADLLHSTRGAKGGYQLARPATEISIRDVLLAIEEDLAVTECSHKKGDCSLESFCSIRNNWQMISDTILTALSALTIADMAKPIMRKQVPVTQEIFLTAIRS